MGVPIFYELQVMDGACVYTCVGLHGLPSSLPFYLGLYVQQVEAALCAPCVPPPARFRHSLCLFTILPLLLPLSCCSNFPHAGVPVCGRSVVYDYRLMWHALFTLLPLPCFIYLRAGRRLCAVRLPADAPGHAQHKCGNGAAAGAAAVSQPGVRGEEELWG